MTEIASIMALVELDLRAVVERYVPSATSHVEDGVLVLDLIEGRQLDWGQLESEIQAVFTFHMPPGSSWEMTVRVVRWDGEIEERTFAATLPPLGAINISLRRAAES